MRPLIAVIVISVAAFAAALWVMARALAPARGARDERTRDRTLDLLTLFAPAVAAAAENPRALVTWQPVAVSARKLFPEEFAALDSAAGAAFPFSAEQMQAAHARWTTEWLTWERTHDAEFKLRVAAAEAEVTASGGLPLARARLDAVEREKLDLYQRRYEEYVRLGKALQALLAGNP